ncbi:MAG: hypothetical protein KatS3mg125_1797 [Lysobacterales bacterium]|nr:MAG: hypothetical protein KatS3mg125_1797 [Xanthomonadales bacterium]
MRLTQLVMGGASIVCALHCLFTVTLLAVLPLSALSVAAKGSLAHELLRYSLWLHGYERPLLALIAALSVVFLFWRWRQHRRGSALAWAGLGVGLVALGFFGRGWPHFVAAAAGGLLVALALLIDWRAKDARACPWPGGVGR